MMGKQQTKKYWRGTPHVKNHYAIKFSVFWAKKKQWQAQRFTTILKEDLQR
jgi:hypothetical protein